MRRVIGRAMVVALTSGAVVWIVGTTGLAALGESPQAGPAASDVDRGKYLVTALVCNDCHTPFKMGDNGPEPDMTRMLSGHPSDIALPPPPKPNGPWIVSGAATFTAWAGPWGISYTANLTPDKDTGLGTWTAQQFIDTIRNGRHQGHGRALLPPMPWSWYRNLTDEDLKAVFAYLQSIPPIKNKVPDPVMAAPTGQ